MNAPIRVCSPVASFRVSRLLCLCCIAALAPVVGTNAAQPAPIDARRTGGITGTVSNAATGANLEGAVVILQPGNHSALTARDGQFVFPAIPAGVYTLNVSYSGLDPKSGSF